MRNRAKCKLCNDIIESKHRNHYVKCKCGEIMIDGGNDSFRSSVQTTWDNFLRIDDDGKEIPVQVKQKSGNETENQAIPIHHNKPNIEDLIGMLNEMNKTFDDLPPHAQFGSVTQCDLNASLLLIEQIIKSLYEIIKERRG